ncbi:hypothetical protein V5F89_12380 [Pelagerythrobacter marensis]|uniref:Uncharacterized protein n=1 Tax=Pelagerythrobacter marensis TaxID=543877 RepID=A0ABZ2D5E2_9SPHN
MIDLGKLEQTLADAEGGRPVTVTPAWLRQVLEELRAGRDAAARSGQVFGLPEGTIL